MGSYKMSHKPLLPKGAELAIVLTIAFIVSLVLGSNAWL